MAELTLLIRMDNTALEDDPTLETGRILRHLATRFELEGFSIPDGGGPLMDFNGNRVGHWAVSGE